jgi:hypothetical protein
MKIETQAPATSGRLLPLLRSISLELTERTSAAAELEARVTGANSKRQNSAADRDALAIMQSELANHRREIRRCEKELAAVGWLQDDRNPMGLVLRSGDRSLAFRPEDTGFHRVRSDTAA